MEQQSSNKYKAHRSETKTYKIYHFFAEPEALPYAGSKMTVSLLESLPFLLKHRFLIPPALLCFHAMCWSMYLIRFFAFLFNSSNISYCHWIQLSTFLMHSLQMCDVFCQLVDSMISPEALTCVASICFNKL